MNSKGNTKEIDGKTSTAKKMTIADVNPEEVLRFEAYVKAHDLENILKKSISECYFKKLENPRKYIAESLSPTTCDDEIITLEEMISSQQEKLRSEIKALEEMISSQDERIKQQDKIIQNYQKRPTLLLPVQAKDSGKEEMKLDDTLAEFSQMNLSSAISSDESGEITFVNNWTSAKKKRELPKKAKSTKKQEQRSSMESSDDDSDFLGFSDTSVEEGRKLLESLQSKKPNGSHIYKPTFIDYSQSKVVSKFIDRNYVIRQAPASNTDQLMVLLDRVEIV